MKKNKIRETLNDTRERLNDAEDTISYHHTRINSLRDERSTQRQVNAFAFIISIIALIVAFFKS